MTKDKPQFEQIGPQSYRYKAEGFHVAECVQYVSAELPPDVADWPQNVMDKLYLAAEQLATESGIKYKFFHAVCDYDLDAKKHFVRAICVAPKGLH